jgi:hypothetical protein
MSRNLIFVAVCVAVIAGAALILVAHRQAGAPPTVPVAKQPDALPIRATPALTGHGTAPVVLPVVAKTAPVVANSVSKTAPVAPRSDVVVAAEQADAGPDLEKIVAGLTREQALKLQQASYKHNRELSAAEYRYNLPIENSLRRMDIVFEQRDLALTVDQLAKLDAVKQKLNAQMEAAGIIDQVNQEYALREQANEILKGLNQSDLTPDQRQQLKDQARVPNDQASQIAEQVSQAKAPLNQQYIDAARTILTPEQNQALDKLIGTPHPAG